MRKIIYLLVAMFTVLASCEKPIEYNQTLGLLSEYNKLDAAGGSTDVGVFSNTTWTVKFQEPAFWASIDRLSGEGCGRVIFDYEQNLGRSRRVILEFRAGNELMTLNMYQAAAIANEDVVMKFMNTNYSAPKEGGEGVFTFQTNLIYDMDRFGAEVTYEIAPDSEWVHLVGVTDKEVRFKVDPNTTGLDRKANLKLTHTDAGAYNSVQGDVLYSDTISITQKY